MAESTTSKSPKTISIKVLDGYMSDLPKSIIEHSKRCYKIAEFILDKVKDEGWFRVYGINSKHLAKAIYYHDIGKTKVEGLLAFRFACKTQREIAEYESHVDKGLELLKKHISFKNIEDKTTLDKYMYYVLRDHHEKWNELIITGIEDESLSFIGQFAHFVDDIDNMIFQNKNNRFNFDRLDRAFKNQDGLAYSNYFFRFMYKYFEDLEKFLKGMYDSLNKKDTKTHSVKTFFARVVNTGSDHHFGFKFDYQIKNGTSYIDSRQVKPSIDRNAVSLKLNNFLFDKLTDAYSQIITEQLDLPLTFINITKYTLEYKDFVKKLLKLTRKERVPHEKLVLILNMTSESDLTIKYQKSLAQLKEEGFKIALSGIGNRTVPVEVLNKLEPEYVFIDSEQMAEAEKSAKKFQVFSGIVEIIRAIGSVIVAEDVDNESTQNAMFTLGIRIQSGKFYKSHIDTKTLIKDLRGE